MAVPHPQSRVWSVHCLRSPSIRLFETPEAARLGNFNRTAWRTPRAAAASRTSCLGADNASDGRSAELVIENIETNVPPPAPIAMKRLTDVGPKRQARAAPKSSIPTAYRSHPTCTQAPRERPARVTVVSVTRGAGLPPW